MSERERAQVVVYAVVRRSIHKVKREAERVRKSEDRLLLCVKRECERVRASERASACATHSLSLLLEERRTCDFGSVFACCVRYGSLNKRVNITLEWYLR